MRSTDDEHAPARHRRGGSQDTRKRLDPHAVELAERVRQRDAVRRAKLLREAAGRDPQLAKLAAGRLVAGETALARAARHSVHDRHAVAVLQHARDLVPQHGAPHRTTELRDVGATEAARKHADQQAGARRLRQVDELREPVGIEYDRTHRRIVGRCVRPAPLP